MIALLLTLVSAAETVSGIDYADQVAPIFAEHCVDCHGPAKQSNGLRLDAAPAALRGGDSGAAIIAGNSAESLLFQVVTGTHEDLRMPPQGPGLTEAQLDTLARWIDAGAVIPDDAEDAPPPQVEHWAFQPIERAAPPTPRQGDWVRNSIDQFVLARLEAEGIDPAPEADRTTLIRRLYLDLLGLPPSPEEVDAFAADPDPYAYEKLVSRLLASPHFGERWARHWLDLARYADSDGYEKDEPRPHAYRYRDWLINAINQDLPYDEFVVQQVAGDLLPKPTTDQLMATGFHRNTLTNKEGGIDPEEDRVKQAADRLNTTGAVFMGLSLSCAECHTHKYDPITHREYFSMYAFFNAAQEKDIPAPRPGEQEAYEAAKAAFDAEVAALQKQIEALKPQLEAELPHWEATLDLNQHGWTVLEPASYLSEGGSGFEKLEDHSLLLIGENPNIDTYTITARTKELNIQAFRLQALTHETLTRGGPGRAHNGNFVLGELKVYAAPADMPNERVQVKIREISADFEEPGKEASKAIDGNADTGWAIYRAEDMNQDRQLILAPEQPVGFHQGTVLTFVLEHTYGRSHAIGRIRLAFTQGNPSDIALPDAAFAALRVPAAERTPAQQTAVLDYFGQFHPEMRALRTAHETVRKSAPKPPATRAQTLAQHPDPPKTFIHLRGDFLSPGEEVQPGVPAFLHPIKPRGATPDRLDFARWIVAPENPLTARVAVNRVWEKLFGEGLARTSEDFGVRSEAPTHPLLLDWLADEFMRMGWSRKQLVRLIVTSATYRQSSVVRPELRDRDPANRLLARQNRFRVEAEITRDLLLAASGLLNPAIGGPSIRPELPEGYANVGYANSIKWNVTEGPEKYRRGMYIWFQRMIAYPMLMTFDCPDSNVSALKRGRSNTPLQALTLMNDPVLFECAQALGLRMLQEAAEPRERIHQAFRWCFGREPQARELDALMTLFEDQIQAYAPIPEDAVKLTGDYLPPDTAPEAAAAHVMLARTLLNLDEFVTRE